MRTKTIEDLEAMLAMWKHDAEVIAEIAEINKLEQDVIQELTDNEEKIEVLMADPSGKGEQSVLDYLKRFF